MSSWLGGDVGSGGEGVQRRGRTATRRMVPGQPQPPSVNRVAAPATGAPVETPPWVHAPTVTPEVASPGRTGFSGPLGLSYGPQQVSTPGAMTAGAPIAYDGPMAASYRAQRVNPHGMVDAPDVSRTFTGAVDPSRLAALDAGRGAFVNPLQTAGGFAGDVDAAERATFTRGMNRLEPGMDLQRRRTLQMLSDRGIPVGSEAYNAEMDRLDQAQADARENLALSAVGAGRQEHDRITRLAAALRGQEFGERAADRGFIAGEEGRGFGERLAARRFDSGEEGRGFGERLAAAGFTASERGRDFGERLASEQQHHAARLAEDRFGADQARFAHGSAVGQAQSARDFNAGQQDADFARRLASQQSRFNQGLAGDSFAAQQAAARDEFGLGQDRWNAQFRSQEARRRYGDALAGSRFQADQRLGHANFAAGQQDADFARRLAAAGFTSGEDARGFQQWLANQNLGLGRRALDLQELGIERGHDASVRGSRWGGIGAIAGATLPFLLSDEDAKVDRGVVGSLPVHEFTYRGDPTGTPYTGVMAGEVAQVMPAAVAEGPDGFRRVSLARMLGRAA